MLLSSLLLWVATLITLGHTASQSPLIGLLETKLDLLKLQNSMPSRSDLGTQLQDLKTNVSTLESTVEGLQTNLAAETTKTAGLVERLDAVEKLQVDHTNQLISLNELLEGVTTSLADVTARLEALEGGAGETLNLDYQSDSLTYDDALAYCTDHGGHLAVLDTLAKIDEAFNTNVGNFMWVGLRRADDDSPFYWHTSTGQIEAIDVPWKSGFPKVGEHCGNLQKGDDGPEVKSLPCMDEKKFLCQDTTTENINK